MTTSATLQVKAVYYYIIWHYNHLAEKGFKMPKTTKLIDEELSTRASIDLAQLGEAGIVAIRLRAIIAAFKHGIKIVAEVYDINRSSLHRWVALYRSGGLESLGNIKKPSRSKLSADQQVIIKSWIEDDNSLTIKAVVIMIKERFGITISKSSVHRLLMRLGFSHITGRAEHYKSDKSVQTELDFLHNLFLIVNL